MDAIEQPVYCLQDSKVRKTHYSDKNIIGLSWQLTRLGVVTGYQLILDATLLRVWHHADAGAAGGLS